MAFVTADSGPYLSHLSMQGTSYTIKDKWAREEIEEIEKRRADIKESHKTKKEEEIPVADKELLDNFSKQEETLKANKESIYASYASQNKIVKQLIDLALLQNGMLKGEALNNFVKRSIELIK